ncbi:MAG: LuxR C-terminal-related transcriptional regulator [Thermodesulfobacteriota bacterium]
MNKPIVVGYPEVKLDELGTTSKNPLGIPEVLRREGRENYGVEQRMCLALNKEGKIISVNEVCAQELGYRVKELIGKAIGKVIYSKDRNRTNGHLMEYISGLSPGLTQDFLMVGKQGNTFLSNCTFYTMHNSVLGTVLFMVSERGSDRRPSGSVIQLFDGLNNKFKKAREITLIVLTPSAILVEGMQKILESEGDMHIIARVSNLNELKPFINSGIPDVLIVDTVAPNLDVNELIMSIGEKDVQTQVLLLLHTPDHQLVVDSLNLGVKGFITKKSKSQRLVQAIRIIRRGEIFGDVKIMKRIIAEFLIRQDNADAIYDNKLTKKEIEIAKLVTEGYSNKVIAKELFISDKTVKTHLNRIYKKLEVTSRYELTTKLR